MTVANKLKKSEETRSRILEAALAVFSERGFDSATMREIAARAHVAVGAAYYYFDSKDAIVMAFYERAQEQMFPATQAILDKSKTLEARLRSIIAHKLEYFAPNRPLLSALSGHADPHHPLSPFSAQTAPIRDQDVSLFARAVEDSQVKLPKRIKPYLPRLLWMYQMGIILFWVYDRSPKQRTTQILFDTTLQMLLFVLRFANLPLLLPMHKLAADLLDTVYADDKESRMNPRPMRPMRIVIPGGSGQVGTLLARHFHAQGHQVTVLTRAPKPAPWQTIAWDGESEGDWIASLEGSDICINLAGRSVNCRYGPENRRIIYDSRVHSTRLLNGVIASLAQPPRLWLNSSTATIYRHSLDKANDEATGEPGGNEPGAPDTWNFSIRVAKDWETAFFATGTPRTRKVAMRSAVTFSADRGGIFDVLSSLIRRGIGGAQGNGAQMVSWIHGADFCRAVDFLIAYENLDGVVNLASPNPLPNREFMRALRSAWHIPIGLPAPAWLIEIGCFFMQTESELVLKSRYAIPTKLLEAGFKFHHPHWPEAANDLVQQWKAAETPHSASAYPQS